MLLAGFEEKVRELPSKNPAEGKVKA